MSDEYTFDNWWHDIGSGLTPDKNHDMYEHTRRVSRLAWSVAKTEMNTHHVTPIQEAKDAFIEAYRNWHNSDGAARLDTALAMGCAWNNLQQRRERYE